MPVKHGLLALLAQRDLTGYELKTRFERALGDFWQLNSGQVYSTLERLRRTAPGDAHEPSPRRDATQRRPGALPSPSEWPDATGSSDGWRRPPGRLRPIRDPLFVKLIFAPPEHLPTPSCASFTAETRRYADAVETLDARSSSATPASSHGPVGPGGSWSKLPACSTKRSSGGSRPSSELLTSRSWAPRPPQPAAGPSRRGPRRLRSTDPTDAQRPRLTAPTALAQTTPDEYAVRTARPAAPAQNPR